MNAFSIIQSAVFVQTNVKTHPHKPALNNILIYTFDSYIYSKDQNLSEIKSFVTLYIISYTFTFKKID